MKIDDCINLDDLRIIAKKRVPKLIYDFIEGGSEDEAGLARRVGQGALDRGVPARQAAGIRCHITAEIGASSNC